MARRKSSRHAAHHKARHAATHKRHKAAARARDQHVGVKKARLRVVNAPRAW